LILVSATGYSDNSVILMANMPCYWRFRSDSFYHDWTTEKSQSYFSHDGYTVFFTLNTSNDGTMAYQPY
jgi:hypothetical protein